jgi:hypothetical protein
MGGSAQLGDDLYRVPLAEFTAARNALARTLKGDEARTVKALNKPAVVAWAVNQVFWNARPAYDALMKAGHALRSSQIATLSGKKSDARAATDAHRKAVTAAVTRARQFASHGKVNPNLDQLTRMFETLSLLAKPPENAGRFVEVIGPSGFEALTGVTPVAPPPSSRDEAKQQKAEEHKKRSRDAASRLAAAERVLGRARERAELARRTLNRAEAEVVEAERAVESAQAAVTNLV